MKTLKLVISLSIFALIALSFVSCKKEPIAVINGTNYFLVDVDGKKGIVSESGKSFITARFDYIDYSPEYGFRAYAQNEQKFYDSEFNDIFPDKEFVKYFEGCFVYEGDYAAVYDFTGCEIRRGRRYGSYKFEELSFCYIIGGFDIAIIYPKVGTRVSEININKRISYLYNLEEYRFYRNYCLAGKDEFSFSSLYDVRKNEFISLDEKCNIQILKDDFFFIEARDRSESFILNAETGEKIKLPKSNYYICKGYLISYKDLDDMSLINTSGKVVQSNLNFVALAGGKVVFRAKDGDVNDLKTLTDDGQITNEIKSVSWFESYGGLRYGKLIIGDGDSPFDASVFYGDGFFNKYYY